MTPPNTICVSQEGPANALALNKDCTQVVIAGRNVFKVFSIGEDEFTEVCNLRVGKNLNLNFSSIDVAWSTIEENTLATAATNGAVVVWNLGRSGRSKQEHVFSDHKRTVNKVSFHLTEPSLLISGSQDGMMKCFDLRMKEVARTFISNTESIRDVQFSPGSAQVFAAVSENGSAQLWDVRRHERPLAQFTAHSGPAFACDWHPVAPWLATASRDKTIKVWDIHAAKPTLEYTIHTIASVGNVKWRPQKKYQVASCALVLDCAVHVWDVRRPHVPLATFAEHRDVTTACRWQSSGAFLATSRDCGLYRHRWAQAAHPVLWANPHAVALSARAQLAGAVPDRPLRLPRPATVAPDQHQPTSLGRKQPTAGSLTPGAQAALERAFPLGATSTLVRRGLPAGSGSAVALAGCAKEYRLHGRPPHELAAHNARVARKYARHMVAHVWSVVALAWGCEGCAAEPSAAQPPPPAPPPPRAPSPPPPFASFASFAAAREEEEAHEEVEEWAEPCFHNSGVLGKPTHAIYIPPARRATTSSGTVTEEEAGAWVSAASAHYVDPEAADWTLPEEAFPLRTAPPAPPAPPASKAEAPSLYALPALEDHDPDAAVSLAQPASASGGQSPASASASSNGSTASPHPNPHHLHTQLSQTEEAAGGSGGGVGGLLLCGGAGGALGARRGRRLGRAALLAAALRHHADLGDVQTAATVLLALQEHRCEVLSHVEETLQEQWLLGYIELLQRHKLYNQATEVVRHAWVGSVWALSQQSTSVVVACGRCGRRTRPHRGCERCEGATGAGNGGSSATVCAVCRRAVRGLFAWCQGCAHGGHLLHVRDWLQHHHLCPAGCGHRCQVP